MPTGAVESEPRSKRAVTLEGRAAWVAWLDRLCEFARAKRSQAIDRALESWARAIGFDEPPPRR